MLSRHFAARLGISTLANAGGKCVQLGERFVDRLKVLANYLPSNVFLLFTAVDDRKSDSLAVSDSRVLGSESLIYVSVSAAKARHFGLSEGTTRCWRWQ
jgi:hypothetical protein